jgi:poly-gamma-glutamate capsule biosynthesis protein CapA/YwtB (metallophosphatase superfamily)
VRRVLLAAAVLALAAAVPAYLAATTTGAAPATHRHVTPATISVRTTLPSWRAPAAPVAVTGFAGAKQHLRLLAAGRLVATTVSGPRGRFTFRFPAPAAGRYRLAVAGPDGRRARAGTLVVRPLVLAAVGDITFGEQVGPAVERHGPGYPWTSVAPILRAADIATGNLEGAVSARGAAVCCKQYTFRGPPAAVRGLAASGFDVLTLANNHSADFGPTALLDTVRLVRAGGIQTIGAGADAYRARRAAIVEAGGLRVAFLGYSDVNPASFSAGAASPGTARADLAQIALDVRAARRRAAVVVCFFHWGVELRADPDSRQRQFASACLNAGAAVVLGAHPHVLGRVIHPSPRTLVAWTLGNFVFPSAGATARSGILRVLIDAHGVRGFAVRAVRIDGFRPVVVRAG